jgi:hypothetical protein
MPCDHVSLLPLVPCMWLTDNKCNSLLLLLLLLLYYTTQMTAENLGIVFAPNLLRAPDAAEPCVADLQPCIAFVKRVIESAPEIFTGESSVLILQLYEMARHLQYVHLYGSVSSCCSDQQRLSVTRPQRGLYSIRYKSAASTSVQTLCMSTCAV